MRLLAILVSLALSVSLSPYAIAEEMPAGANTQQQLLSEGELDAIVAPMAENCDLLAHRLLVAVGAESSAQPRQLRAQGMIGLL